MSRSRTINLENIQQFAAINVLSDPGYDPGFHPIPNGIEVILNWTLQDGKTGHNVLGGQVAGGYSPTAAQCDAILSGLTSGGSWTGLAAYLSTTCRLAGVTLQDMRSAGVPPVSSTGAGAVGTSAALDMPNEVAAAITLKTVFSGKQNTGRMYVPGFAANAMAAGNVIAAATVTALNTWGSSIAGILTAQGITWALLHRQRLAYTGVSGAAHPARPAGTIPILQAIMRDNHWDTQRRRGLR